MKSRDAVADNDTQMSIGQTAARFGLATHVLRHWEAMGLLHPARMEGDRRRYSPDDLYRIAVILRGKQAGFSLDDIREVITTEDPATRRTLLARRRDDLIRRIATAQAALQLVECALDCEHGDFIQCRHFQAAIAQRIAVNPLAHRPVLAGERALMPG